MVKGVVESATPSYKKILGPALDSNYFKMIEQLIVVLYDKTSPLTSVNELRGDLYCWKSRSVERIPPTQNTLLQYVQRAVYQGQHVHRCSKLCHLHKLLGGPRSQLHELQCG